MTSINFDPYFLFPILNKWPSCNFEKFETSAIKEIIEQQERSCQNESPCVVLGSYSHVTINYRHLDSG